MKMKFPKMLTKKGLTISDLAPVAILFVVAGIALGIGADILANIQTGITGNVASQAVNNATEGINKVAKWMPTIGMVVAAAIIIGLIFRSFTTRTAG